MSYTTLGGGSGDTFGVDEAGVDNVVSRMEDSISTIKTSINQIDESVQAVAAGWQGEAHGQFKTAAADWHQEVIDLNEKLDRLSQAVTSGKKTIVGSDGEGL
ncbi:WXG100 family type VII secretion target [Nocardia sp. NPDC058176]|uniref:WXG100 family type VII secretion target n=1 Tax=Nocardia sp. NPDC058176 TaxID=3346368 RepID=UPI0036DF3333